MFLFFSTLQILFWLKQVNFTLDNTSVYFDMNGDPPTGYDLTCWAWRGKSWSLRDIGTFNPDPITLTIDADKIEWHNADYSKQVRPFEQISPNHNELFVQLPSQCILKVINNNQELQIIVSMSILKQIGCLFISMLS